ncbi:MAG: hypothetical protein AAF961_11445, partial [Planctomycetota bacterium]
MLKLATKFAPQPAEFGRAADAGYQFAELWLDVSWLDRWQEITREAGRHAIDYALHFPNRGDVGDEPLQAVVHLYDALGCSALVIHAPMYRRYGERLLEFAPTLRLAVENHRLNLEDFNRWANENRWLTLDVEHLWKLTLRDAPFDALLEILSDFLDRYG